MTIKRELTSLEQQLIAECEKLIAAIRQIRLPIGHERAKAEKIADKVADFITNLD